jgi:hypothetical protein
MNVWDSLPDENFMGRYCQCWSFGRHTAGLQILLNSVPMRDFGTFINCKHSHNFIFLYG